MNTNCNLGYSYYKTKIGVPYPGLKRDMFGESFIENGYTKITFPEINSSAMFLIK